MAVLMPQGKQQYLADDGTPLSGGKLYTYAAGTSTPLATYSEYTGTTANANPVILDARGEAPIYWSAVSYKVVLKTSADVTVWTQDNIEPSPPASDLSSTAAGKGAALIGYSTLGITVKDALDLKAPLASPALTGSPTAPTQSAGDNSTKLSTTAYADAAAAAAAAAAVPSFATVSEVGGTHTTGSITSGTAALTVASGTGIADGDYVVGEGIAPGTTVSSGGGTTSITLSANANATLSSDPVGFYSATTALSPANVAGGLCVAWANWDGTGTVSIGAARNVTSIMDNGGSGDFTINFTNALPDANYCALFGARRANASSNVSGVISERFSPATRTVSALRVLCGDSATGFVDSAVNSVAIFR